MPHNWFGDEVMGAVGDAKHKALYEGSGALLTAANKTCPHDEGTLERSGTNVVKSMDGDLKGVVFYDTPYAVAVHEADPSVNFRGKGRRKWLEQTAKEKRQRIHQKMGEILEEELG